MTDSSPSLIDTTERIDTAKRPYHGTTLVRFGAAASVTLGCPSGDTLDCDPQGIQYHEVQ